MFGHGTICRAQCSLSKHCLVSLLGLVCVGTHRLSCSTLLYGDLQCTKSSCKCLDLRQQVLDRVVQAHTITHLHVKRGHM